MSRLVQGISWNMCRCVSARRLLSAGLVVVVWLAGTAVVPGRGGAAPPANSARHNDEDDDDDLPPLTLDAAQARPLEEAAGAPLSDHPIAASVAENAACYVCHANYQAEELVTLHVAGDVGCVDCHGKSYAHRNDENNTTPPDVMFPRDTIDLSCTPCHDAHDIPAADVVRRWQERAADRPALGAAVCTDCHGHHRLPHRTVVWDRATRALITDSADLPPEAAPPVDLGVLSGTWVRVGAVGTPGDRLTITIGPDQRIQGTWQSASGDLPPRALRLD